MSRIPDPPINDTFIERFRSAGIEAGDPFEPRLSKSLLMLATGLVSVTSMLWLTIYWVLGPQLSSTIPLAIQLLLVANLFLYTEFMYKPVVTSVLWSLPYEVAMYIVLPFLYLAGKAHGVRGIIVLWCIAVAGAIAQPYVSSRLGVAQYAAALTALGNFMGNAYVFPVWLSHVINLTVSFTVITILFALMFKFLPDAEIAWRDVLLGAAVTSLLFNLAKFALGFYLGRSSVASTFGAAGSLALI